MKNVGKTYFNQGKHLTLTCKWTNNVYIIFPNMDHMLADVVWVFSAMEKFLIEKYPGSECYIDLTDGSLGWTDDIIFQIEYNREPRNIRLKSENYPDEPLIIIDIHENGDLTVKYEDVHTS